MSPRFKYLLPVLLLLFSQMAFGQHKGYQYKRPLKGVSESWHRLKLPNELFARLNPDLADLRIKGFNHAGDTVEAPYLLEELRDQLTTQEVPFKILNQSRIGNRYFYTLEISEEKEVNQIILEFKENNFDREVMLEGSRNLDQWYSILQGYRIVSVQNDWTNYSFRTIRFPNSKYLYYRLSFQADEQPGLLEAKVNSAKVIPGQYRVYSVEEVAIKEDKKKKETVVDIELPSLLPISQLQLDIKESFDYYRPLSIQYLADSSFTPKGWIFHYQTLTAEVLSSLEKSNFSFPTVLARKLRIIIYNGDNAALQLDEVVVKGTVYELKARFTEPADYYLFYGNPAAHSPEYDLENFRDKIPNQLPEVSLGEEQIVLGGEVMEAHPLFQDQRWLWAIMGAIIVLLAWFSLNMIKNA